MGLCIGPGSLSNVTPMGGCGRLCPEALAVAAGTGAEPVAEMAAQRGRVAKADLQRNLVHAGIGFLQHGSGGGQALRQQPFARRHAHGADKVALEAARAADHRVRKSEHETRVVRSELEAAEANLRLARADLEKLQIYAPMAATVASRDVNPGEMIQPGQALLTLIDTRSLYLNATVSDHDVSRIRVGQPVEVRFEALKGRVFPGQVQEILPPTSPQERNFHAKIRLERREPSIQTGMLATGSGIVARHQNVLTIPEAAFLASAPDSHEGTVYVVEDGVARRRSVGVAARIDGMWVVREGLKEGEQVVVDGQAMLKDGRPVRVR